jgi:hypothetical protein
VAAVVEEEVVVEEEEPVVVVGEVVVEVPVVAAVVVVVVELVEEGAALANKDAQANRDGNAQIYIHSITQSPQLLGFLSVETTAEFCSLNSFSLPCISYNRRSTLSIRSCEM